MRLRRPEVFLFLASLLAVTNGQGQAAKGYIYATDPNVAVCNASDSDLIQANCDSLAMEFNNKATAKSLVLNADGTPLANTGLTPSLVSPPIVLGSFITGVRKRAYADLVKNTLRGNAQKAAQAALIQLTQLLSTKSAVNQTGATSSASGSTTLALKPTTTDLISLAAESGAFTDTLNGNSLTAQTNVNGLRRYLTNKPFADLSPTAIDRLEHITLAATFSVGQSGSSAVATTGSATTTPLSLGNILLPSNNVSFSSLSVNYSLMRPYSPNSKAFNSKWKAAEQANAEKITNVSAAIFKGRNKLEPALEKVESDNDVLAAQTTWLIAAQQDELKGDFAKFVADYKVYTDKFVNALLKADPDIDSEILDLNVNLEALRQVNEDMLDAARGTLLTMSYSYATPLDKPATHSATLATSYVFKNGQQFTANAAGTWFASIPAGAKYGRVQSYQFSSEFDGPMGGTKLGNTVAIPRATYSLAGYGQYQYEPTVLNITAGNLAPGTNITLAGTTQEFVGTAGWLGVAQAKLAFNIGKGMTIPVAFKWSSKTDLVDANDWKGQFGVSYDFTALSSLLSGIK